MRLIPCTPPREFRVGRDQAIRLQDCGRIELQPDEQVSFVTASGAQYDVARKAWGFYATPSLNGRLASFGLRAVLVRNEAQRFYVLLVERGREDLFHRYLEQEGQTLVCWLDSDEALAAVERAVHG